MWYIVIKKIQKDGKNRYKEFGLNKVMKCYIVNSILKNQTILEIKLNELCIREKNGTFDYKIYSNPEFYSKGSIDVNSNEFCIIFPFHCDKTTLITYKFGSNEGFFYVKDIMNINLVTDKEVPIKAVKEDIGIENPLSIGDIYDKLTSKMIEKWGIDENRIADIDYLFDENMPEVFDIANCSTNINEILKMNCDNKRFTDIDNLYDDDEIDENPDIKNTFLHDDSLIKNVN